jgi:hypothetical protein
MRWTIEDNTSGTGGYLRILKDGQRVSDVFPFARETDAEFVRTEAQRIVDQMNAVDAAANPSGATASCGCVFCDLKLPLHEDEVGFHHVAEGKRVACAISAN